LESPPLVLHYLEHGRFLNRINEIEAKAVVKAVENELNSSKSIGIVAFSQEQIDCIWKLFSVSTQNRLMSQWENGVGFIKPLEKVQGEECDVLYISMGYAKNEQGNFQLKMGPLNRRNGHRRLNVLLTRAKHQLHFFTSVRSTEFSNTENESINLLKRYLEWLESSPSIPNLVFPFELNHSIQGNNVSLRHVHTSIPSASELVTFYRVIKSRGWEINFC
jgi:superfamily I DNA and/or RNA helicase